MFSFDIKNSYHHVLIFPPHQRFLRFPWFYKGKVWYFCSRFLPFGLSSALFLSFSRSFAGYLLPTGAGGHAHAFLLILSSIWRHLELTLSSKVIQKTQRETNNHSFLEAPALTINILYVNDRVSAFYLKTATCWLPWRWLMHEKHQTAYSMQMLKRRFLSSFDKTAPKNLSHLFFFLLSQH